MKITVSAISDRTRSPKVETCSASVRWSKEEQAEAPYGAQIDFYLRSNGNAQARWLLVYLTSDEADALALELLELTLRSRRDVTAKNARSKNMKEIA